MIDLIVLCIFFKYIYTASIFLNINSMLIMLLIYFWKTLYRLVKHNIRMRASICGSRVVTKIGAEYRRHQACKLIIILCKTRACISYYIVKAWSVCIVYRKSAGGFVRPFFASIKQTRRLYEQ